MNKDGVMICFFTSHVFNEALDGINPANRFVDELRACFPKNCRGLYVASDPESHEKNDRVARIVNRAFERDGMLFESIITLDSRNEKDAAELVEVSDLLFLTGGHVPTQNRFFEKIGLRKLVKGFDGVVIGLSAGSMNSADEVYSEPELPGETKDPNYNLFLKGLGLTKRQILPHYYSVKDDTLDGLRIIEEISIPNSKGRTFYAIPDGSYIFSKDGREELRGEAYKISNGKMEKIADEGDVVVLK